MMAETRPSYTVLNRVIAACGAVSALLLGRMILWDGPAFEAAFEDAKAQWSMPDALFSGYDQTYVQNLRNALENTPVAQDIMRSMHLGTDMLLPLVLGLFMSLLLVRFMSGTFFFGRIMNRQHILLLLLLPLGYVISDYAENMITLMYFQPSQPSPAFQDQLSMLLPWCTKLKFMFIAITALILVRQFLFNQFIAKSGH